MLHRRSERGRPWPTATAIIVEGVRKRYGDTSRPGRARPDRSPRHGARRARPERRGQDHLRPHPGHPAAARRRPGRGRRATTCCARPDEVRHRIGLLGQHAALDEELSGRQNLEMFGRLHHLGAGARAAVRADELLERFGLGGHRHARRSGSTAAACAAGWTWPPASSLTPAGAVPGRADHRARPARPHRGVGSRSAPWSAAVRRSCSPPSTWRRPTSSPTASAVVDRGRVDRRRHGGRAQGPHRRRPHRRRPARRRSTGRRRPVIGMAARAASVETDRARLRSAPRSPTAWPPSPRSYGRWTRPGSRRRTSPCAAPPWTRCSCTSPATPERTDEQGTRDDGTVKTAPTAAEESARMTAMTLVDSWTMTRRGLAHWARAARPGGRGPGLPGDDAADVRVLPRRRR